MQFFPTDDLRSLCKDEKSFRALSEMVQSYLALSGAGVGKEYWASYLAHCSDLVLEVDLAGKVIAVHSTGKSNGKKQFIGRNLMHLLPSSLAKKFPAAIEKAFKEQQPERLFLDSETDTAFLVLSPVSSPSGMNSALAIFPASKFKSGIKRRLNESERKYRYLFEKANDSILITDPETHIIIDANALAAKSLGYRITELLGMKIEDITAPENESALNGIRAKLFSRGNSIFEAVHMSSSGKRIPVEVSSSQIRYEGKPAYLNFVRDISDRKRAEALLARKGEELNVFLYRASHDLKGPIATIRGLLLVAGLEVTDPAARYYFDLLQTAAGRLDTNLTDIIQISTINRVQLKPSVLDMNELLTEVIHDLAPHFNLDSFRLDLKIGNKHRPTSDRKMVRNILLQLLSNAMKYSSGLDREPAIGVQIKPDEKGIEIIVSDNGAGIPEETREQIFDMFFRGDTQIPGNGLGLTILRNSVQKLGGEIGLDSKVGVGTTFKINLPSIHAGVEANKKQIKNSA